MKAISWHHLSSSDVLERRGEGGDIENSCDGF